MPSPRALAALAAVPLAVTVLTACGPTGPAGHGAERHASPAEYGAGQRAITARTGDEFTLKLPARPFMGEHWHLAEPRPDAGVLEYRGRREKIEPAPKGVAGGGDGADFFDFTALAPGTTTVKLLHCALARCAATGSTPASSTPAGDASASPVPTATALAQDPPAYFLYTVTVRRP